MLSTQISPAHPRGQSYRCTTTPLRRALRSRLNADLSCVISGALTRRVTERNSYSSSTVLKSAGITISSTSQSSE
jgi:hypothetical protein